MHAVDKRDLTLSASTKKSCGLNYSLVSY